MRKKNMILILVLTLVIGFSAVSATLVLNGTIGISNKASDFNVIFTNAKLDNVEKKEFIDTETKKKLTFTTNKLTSLDDPATIVEYEVTNTSRLYDANVVITCDLVNEADQKIESEYISMDYIPKSMTVEAGKKETGSITATLVKPITTDKDIKVKCNLTATPIERTSMGSEYIEPGTYKLVTDEDGDGKADIGDEIAIGTEHFYVMFNNGRKLTGLAKYNLKVGNIVDNTTVSILETISPTEEGYGIQNSQMLGWASGDKRCGTVSFSNTNEWPEYEEKETIDLRNDSHADGPVKDALYGENGYEKYIQRIIPESSLRLINYEEVQFLYSYYLWIRDTTYWTQSANSERGDGLWTVATFGDVRFNHYGYEKAFGVRPVVEIPLKEGKENVDTYTVTFNTDGGSVDPTSKQVMYGEPYGNLPIPTREYSKFLGWCISTEDEEVITSTTRVNQQKDHTLYAKWEIVGPIISLPKGHKLLDKNQNGKEDIGEEIIIGEERFYVISNNGTELNALAKYNLNVGDNKNPDVPEGIQHETIRGSLDYKPKYGNVSFSDSIGWASSDDSIDIKLYNGPVKEALYGTNGYENYIKGIIPDANASVRLIIVNELENLVNEYLEGGGDIETVANELGYSWLYSTAYWTQSPYNRNELMVMESYGYLGHDANIEDYYYGVRPVVTIPLS